ncbi:MAG: adenylyl-sulfate kinase [Oscillibacter sp.]|nr:adenylyl-sulfate kinase [Oscillibacter sp.]
MAYYLNEINEAIRSDPKGFVEECDAAYTKKVENAAKKIAEHQAQSHIILLSGPSGSGKTTTALKVEEQLEKLGIETHTVSMDNYFNTIDPETAPRNRQGEIDFESPFCLDVNLLNRHFAMLDRGETIHVPKYEFARQMRSNILSQPLRLDQKDMAIFEGIHALNDIIVGKNPKAFKLYIAARSSLRDEMGNIVFDHAWLRLCRRIVRDALFRGYDATSTLKLWDNVRRGEKLYISPYKESADLLFDSCLAFEFSLLKPIVVPLLEAVPQSERPGIVDDMLQGFRNITALEDTSIIPPTSLAREFIGGSTYDNH